jgi:hypothetical protein
MKDAIGLSEPDRREQGPQNEAGIGTEQPQGSRTFTQSEVDAIVQKRLSKLRRDARINGEPPSDKTGRDRKNVESRQTANGGQNPGLMIEERLSIAEMKLDCILLGVPPENIDDVIFVARKLQSRTA